MSPSPVDRCSRCPAEIIWVYNLETGKSQPLDKEPHPAGNILLTGETTARGALIIDRILKKTDERPEGRDRYRSHFATCPAAQTFRRPR